MFYLIFLILISITLILNTYNILINNYFLFFLYIKYITKLYKPYF